jgi:hypothetical protein
MSRCIGHLTLWMMRTRIHWNKLLPKVRYNKGTKNITFFFPPFELKTRQSSIFKMRVLLSFPFLVLGSTILPPWTPALTKIGFWWNKISGTKNLTGSHVLIEIIVWRPHRSGHLPNTVCAQQQDVSRLVQVVGVGWRDGTEWAEGSPRGRILHYLICSLPFVFDSADPS